MLRLVVPQQEGRSYTIIEQISSMEEPSLEPDRTIKGRRVLQWDPMGDGFLYPGVYGGYGASSPSRGRCGLSPVTRMITARLPSSHLPLNDSNTAPITTHNSQAQKHSVYERTAVIGPMASHRLISLDSAHQDSPPTSQTHIAERRAGRRGFNSNSWPRNTRMSAIGC